MMAQCDASSPASRDVTGVGDGYDSGCANWRAGTGEDAEPAHGCDRAGGRHVRRACRVLRHKPVALVSGRRRHRRLYLRRMAAPVE